ncbi:MAG: response regulator [Ktedonobacteraceae bacterium]|nr:response regulator [Ktedonobacteraceae bacterium]
MALDEKKSIQRENTGRNIILLIEDDRDIAEALTLLLESEMPYQVMALASSEEALERLDEIKAIQPVLFMIDYFLPVMTGIELYDRLHAIEGLGHIPALIITAHLAQDVEEDVSRRNLDLLYKPFELDDLFQTLRQVVA